MEMGADVLKRPALIRRPTTLHHGLGDFSRTTEYSNFAPFVGLHRPELRRRGTSLRMEGDFEGRSEKEEQFVEWPRDSLVRPRPFRLPSNLRLEGEMQVSTECRDKYVPFVGARRPDLLKQSAQITVEADASWTPEYQRVFKQHHCPERPAPKIPVTNLKAGAPGGFFDENEGTGFLPNTEDKEADLMDELMRDIEDEEEEKKRREEEDEKNMNEEEEDENSQRKEEEMRLLVSKLENLKGPSLEVPEYKASFKDFPRERPKLMRPEDEIGRADGTKVTSPSPVRFKTKIDQDPEYKSIFLDPAYRDRHFFQRPGPSFRPSNCSSGRNSFFRVSAMDNRVENGSAQNSSRRDSRPVMSEIRSQYVDYGQVPRVESLRMPTSLRLEGNLDMEPEYRDAYCQPSQPSQPRRRERSLSASRRRESSSQLVPTVPNGNASGSHWIDNNNGEVFGTVNAADEQDAFQVLHTRLHEESVVGKPPPGSRRNSRYSLPRASMQSDMTSTAGIEKQPEQQPRVRSPSPSGPFRLQVSHADEEPRGFIARRSRRSPSHNLLVRSSSDRSPSPIQHATERPYSPSFARDASAEGRQAFVVLDEGGLNEVVAPAPPRRRRTDLNVDPRDSVTSLRGCNGAVPKPRNRTPPNWMPPWYDSSTSTI